MSYRNLSQEFVQAITQCANCGVLTKDILQDHKKANFDLHGILESALVQAGWSIGWIPSVEPRVPLSVPLEPARYNKNLSGRRRWQFRPDVGYHHNNTCDIFAECCTTDEAGDYIPSNQTPQYDPLRKGHVTKRDALLHFVQYANLKANLKVSKLVICVTLPHQMKKIAPWPRFKSVGRDFFKAFKPGWDTLAQNLNQYTSTDLIIIEENGVHVNKVFQPVMFP